jgi:hypothetical protein
MIVQDIMNTLWFDKNHKVLVMFIKFIEIFTIEYSPESETGSSLRKKSRLSSASSLGAADFQTIQEK